MKAINRQIEAGASMAAGKGDTSSQARPSMLRLMITAGLSVLVVASLVFAAFNLDLDGYSVQVRAEYLAVAILLFALMALFETWRLAALAPFKASAGLEAWGINAAAMALVQAPLGIVGAEAYRANAYVRRGENLSAVLAAILVARALGLACMLVLIALAAGFLADQIPTFVKRLAGVAAAMGLGVILAGPVLLRRWPMKRGGRRVVEFASALAALSSAQLLWATVWSLCVVAARAFALWACAAGLGAPISLAFAVFGSAAGLFLSLIPFVSGIVGVREGGIAGLLLLAGLPLAMGVLVGFAMRIGAVAGALISIAASYLLHRGQGA